MGSGEGLVWSVLLLKLQMNSQMNICVKVFNRILDLGLILSKLGDEMDT